MPSPRLPRLPSLRRHAPSGRAVTTLNGRDFYLGAWPEGMAEPPDAVRVAYHDLIAEWTRNGRKPFAPVSDAQPPGPTTPTVASIALRYMEHVTTYYVDGEGKPTSEVVDTSVSLRPLVFLFGNTKASEFGPAKLKQTRQLLIDGYVHPNYGPQPAISRKLINQRVGRMRRCFKWAAEEELVPPSIYHGLMAVSGLRAGRSAARETKPVLPVAMDVVEATLPHLPAHVAGLVRFLAATGCRPGEAARLTLSQVEMTGDVWKYTPKAHKTAWRGKSRTVMMGPKAQRVIYDFVYVACPRCGKEGRAALLLDRGGLCWACADDMAKWPLHGPWPLRIVQPPERPLFSPAMQGQEIAEAKRRRRKSKVPPSQLDRRKVKPKRKPREAYTTISLVGAIHKACKRAKVPQWSAGQLRHTVGTAVRAAFGIEAASTILGHANLNTSEIYAEKNMSLAERIARLMG